MQQNRILTESNGLGKTQEGELASKIGKYPCPSEGKKGWRWKTEEERKEALGGA